MKFTLTLKIKGYDKPLPDSELGPGVIAVQEVEYSDDADPHKVAVVLAEQMNQLVNEFMQVTITEGFPHGKEEGDDEETDCVAEATFL